MFWILVEIRNVAGPCSKTGSAYISTATTTTSFFFPVISFVPSDDICDGSTARMRRDKHVEGLSWLKIW